ncbi:hypothetical protein HAX54_022999 [Datura stramonium]|uniref:Uncharacterized protein n=1 Tax=Datura stramonium TaxID=4076 RepID=A0ABS8UWM3_DATST|nr:hypothetical protein [Datura stramonium]
MFEETVRGNLDPLAQYSDTEIRRPWTNANLVTDSVKPENWNLQFHSRKMEKTGVLVKGSFSVLEGLAKRKAAFSFWMATSIS